MEIDHLFVLVEPDTDEATADRLDRATRCLTDAGLREGSSNDHPGQGTANRRFFFGNAMFELLYFTDLEAARRPPADVLQLPARASGRGACPFGVAFRPSTEPGEPARFEHVHYRPIYLPDTLSIHVAASCPVSGPLWFHLPFIDPGARPPAGAPRGDVEPRDHPAGLDRLTRLGFVTPSAPSRLDRSVSAGQPIDWTLGERHWLTLSFDDERQGRGIERVADLPLSFRF